MCEQISYTGVHKIAHNPEHWIIDSFIYQSIHTIMYIDIIYCIWYVDECHGVGAETYLRRSLYGICWSTSVLNLLWLVPSLVSGRSNVFDWFPVWLLVDQICHQAHGVWLPGMCCVNINCVRLMALFPESHQRNRIRCVFYYWEFIWQNKHWQST